MKQRTKALISAAAAAALLAACGSSKSTSTGGGSGKPAITIGVFGDFTGLGASGNKTSILGVKAGIHQAALDGIKIDYVQADSQTSPTAAQTAADQLVDQDHVKAVLVVSSLFFLVASTFQKAGIPVVGVAEDGAEWATDTNMFSASGFLIPTAVSDATGKFFQMEGATDVGALGYGISPTSADAATGATKSAQAVGLTVGYLNANFPFGSTNVAPVAIQMKDHGVNGITSETDPNTTFALIQALHQAGDDLKVALVPDGYGGDLSQAGAEAAQIGQGAYFTLSYEPVEMETTATKQFQADLASVGVTGLPTYAEYAGYASVALLVQGLQAAGSDPTDAQLISALSGITNFNAWGLLGSHDLSMADRAASAIGDDGCGYYTKLVGTNFELVPGADPLCGNQISG